MNVNGAPPGLWHLELDYRLNPEPRYELARTPHAGLLELLGRNREGYRSILLSFSEFAGHLARIQRVPPAVRLSPEDWASIPARYDRAFNGDSSELAWFAPVAAEVARETAPCWLNGFIPGLDGVALYAFTAINRPRTYLEVGSGNSTKFVRQAISDHRLPTRIVSIDPLPRADIDSLCDEVIRKPLEECEHSVFDGLEAGDVLFMDGSHRCFTNSDTTVFFLDVLPRLAHGVLVGIHDIFLPYDYPRTWIRRGYSEQYVVAAALLAGAAHWRIEFPSLYVSLDPELAAVSEKLWARIPNVVSKRGTSFWFRCRDRS